MIYIVTDYKKDVRIGKFDNEQQAQELAKRYADNGVYVIVRCYENNTTNKLANLVYSSNEQNWRGVNGNWNTNQ